MGAQTELKVEGRTIKVSNLEKVLYPKVGFTKGEVIDYYIRVAPVLLPHLKNRALTLKRYPNGVEEPFFDEKRCPPFRPPWVKTAPIWSEGHQQNIDYCLVNELPTLVWAANLADLELHTSLALWKHPNRPTVMVFDLDPRPLLLLLGVLPLCQFAFAPSEHETLLGLLPLASRPAQKLLQEVRPWIEPAQSYEKINWG